MEIFLDLLKTKFAWMSLWYQIVRVKKKVSVLFLSRVSLIHTNLVLWWPVLGILSLSTSSNLLWFLWNCFPIWKWILCIQSALVSILCWFCECIYMAISLCFIIRWKSVTAFYKASLSTNHVLCNSECSAAFVTFVNTIFIFCDCQVLEVMKY